MCVAPGSDAAERHKSFMHFIYYTRTVRFVRARVVLYFIYGVKALTQSDLCDTTPLVRASCVRSGLLISHILRVRTRVYREAYRKRVYICLCVHAWLGPRCPRARLTRNFNYTGVLVCGALRCVPVVVTSVRRRFASARLPAEHLTSARTRHTHTVHVQTNTFHK